MAAPRLCEYAVLQLAPDPIRNELVNIGVALRDTQGDYVAVFVTHDFRRVRCLFPDFDTAHLAGLQQSLEAALRRDPKQLAYQAEETFSQSLRVSGFHGLTTADPAAAARDLYRRLVLVLPPLPMERRRHGMPGSRRLILAQLRSRFSEAGVLSLLASARSAAALGLEGDPFRFDFYYRKSPAAPWPRQVVLQAVDLGAGSARIKELCFTVQSLRSRLEQGLEARAVYDYPMARAADPAGSSGPDLGALPRRSETDADLMPQVRQHAAFLREAGIQLIPLEQTPELVAQVRRDLALG